MIDLKQLERLKSSVHDAKVKKDAATEARVAAAAAEEIAYSALFDAEDALARYVCEDLGWPWTPAQRLR